MWIYKDISREEFEKIKDRCEEIMVSHGAKIIEVDLPYPHKITSIIGNDRIICDQQRRVFEFNSLYYRISEVCFKEKPCIVAEIGTYDELMNNIMEDSDPFPFDLTDQELDDEVSYFLGEKPYPNQRDC